MVQDGPVKGSSLLLHDVTFNSFECDSEGLLLSLLLPDLRTGPTDPAGAGQPKIVSGGLKQVRTRLAMPYLHPPGGDSSLP